MIRKVVLFVGGLILGVAANHFSASAAHADFHRFQWNPAPADGNTAAGRAIYFEHLYVEDTGLLKFYVEFVPQAGVLPSGFQLAMNDGPNPKGHDGELAFLYFNGNDPANPKLTVYGYNGLDMESWIDGSQVGGTQAPDKILSTEAPAGSAQNPAGWVKELKVFQDGTKKAFLMTIDTTLINTHVPAYPGGPGMVWKGLKFGPLLGMWFHPVANVTAAYGADGFLTNWVRGIVGWYDTANQATGMVGPQCEAKIKSPVPVVAAIGVPFFTSVVGESFLPGKFFPEVFTVTYTGLPPGAVLSIPQGSQATLPVGGGIETELNWTPSPGDGGKVFNINVTFTNQDGLSVSCPFALAVPDNAAPICDAGASAALQGLACTSPSTTANLDASKSFDPDNSAAAGGGFTYAWTTDCPGGSFNNATGVAPALTFNSETAGGLPVSCKAFLAVSDGFKSASCEAVVSVAGCLRDCAGTINGVQTFDVCGVCGGSGMLDRCSVCNGNGQTCLGCAGVNISEKQFTLDNNSQLQQQLVKKAITRLKRLSRTASTRAYAQKTLAQAEALQENSWVTIWSLPQIFNLCTNTLFCKSEDLTASVKTYTANSETFKKLLEGAVKKVVTARGGRASKGDKALLSSSSKLHQQNLEQTSQIPAALSVCS